MQLSLTEICSGQCCCILFQPLASLVKWETKGYKRVRGSFLGVQVLGRVRSHYVGLRISRDGCHRPCPLLPPLALGPSRHTSPLDVCDAFSQCLRPSVLCKLLKEIWFITINGTFPQFFCGVVCVYLLCFPGQFNGKLGARKAKHKLNSWSWMKSQYYFHCCTACTSRESRKFLKVGLGRSFFCWRGLHMRPCEMINRIYPSNIYIMYHTYFLMSLFLLITKSVSEN